MVHDDDMLSSKGNGQLILSKPFNFSLSSHPFFNFEYGRCGLVN